MGKRRIFISFDFNQLKELGDLESFFQAAGGPVRATPRRVEQDVSAGGEPAIKKAIRERMQSCVGLVLLVSNDTHNSPWMTYEVGLANSMKIPVVAIRGPGVTGDLPQPHKGIHVIDWDRDKLAAVVDGWPRKAGA